MRVCLVTGGAGFIGSHLVEALLKQGSKVRVIDNLSTGNLSNLDGVANRIEWIQGDICNLETMKKATVGVDVVFHQAALPSVPRSVADPLTTHQVCVNGTLNVLLASRQNKVRRVVYAASSSAYGNPPLGPTGEIKPKRESDSPMPLSPYAASKLAGEQYCVAFSQVYGLETVRLRYFNVFGPRQSPDSPYAPVIAKFIQKMVAGEQPVIQGDGEQSRDFTYISDVVQANLKAADANGVSGKLFNIACGQRTSLLQLVSMLNQLLGTSIVPIHEKGRLGDVKHSLADITAARKDLGYEPGTDMIQCISKCLEYWQKKVSSTRPESVDSMELVKSMAD